MKHIFLYGPPGSGKSTVGPALAEGLGLPFLDLDSRIEGVADRSIQQIVAEHDEATFRDLEHEALAGAVAGKPTVIALGGGALLRDENRALAESAGRVVCLGARLDTLMARLRDDPTQRPLLAGELEHKLTALLEKRGGHYGSFEVRICSDDRAPLQIAREIEVAIGRFRVGGMEREYDALVVPGGLDRLGESLREREMGGPAAVVTESNVGPIYAERALKSLRAAGYEATSIRVPAGEAAKNIDTVMSMWRGFLAAGLDRRSTVVALGGGVAGDMAGFAASTFMRGCPWVVVPTSLLSMVDASLGGKTGFDLAEGKNLVGAFHPPSLVLADPDVLATLPDLELRSGLAEVLKHGIIADPGLFELCAGGYEAVKRDLSRIVPRAMAVKIDIIKADPYERGTRAALNLGHTVGHAVELVSGFELRHGEAIAIGMVVEARLAERLGKAAAGLGEVIATALDDLGLPTRIPDQLSREAILRAMQVDKKKSSGVVKFALPVGIGKVEVGVAVEDLSLVFE